MSETTASDVTDPEVRKALDVLNAAGWRVRLDTGWGGLDGEFLVYTYGGGGKKHARWSIQEPWREVAEQSSGDVR